MINSPLVVHLAAAFVVGSLCVVIITIVAERRGSLLGGVLGGLPSTSAFSFLFVGVNQSSAEAVQATTLFPLAFAITSAYLFFFALFARKGFDRGIILSLLIWFGVSAVIVASRVSDFVFSLAGGAVISALTYLAFTKTLKLPNLTGGRKLYRTHKIVFRGIGAGALVGMSVFLSQIGGPIIGGVAAAFPAVFTSTLIILNRSRGTEFSRAITKPLVLSGILTIIPYSVAVRFLYPSLGVWLGTLFSYALVVPLAALSYFGLKRSKEFPNDLKQERF
jgi:uncharacterized membrane protein (GlpM family)